MKIFFFFIFLLSSISFLHATEFEGFIDSYYAYDLLRPKNLDRAYVTSSARHNEFNINLAHISAKIENENNRGRLALQYGTSVQSNYAGEPTIGAVSGASLTRNIQEAYIGQKVGESAWLEAGIFSSYIGAESFTSKQNPTYTRSMVAEFSPYFQAGVRASFAVSDRFSYRLLVLNGWQNISENNKDKALGIQLAYKFENDWQLTYNNFLGQESGLRNFHDFILTKNSGDTNWILQADIGYQSRKARSSATWFGAALIFQKQFSLISSLSLRAEVFNDTNAVVAMPISSGSFQVLGASINFDRHLSKVCVWRSELKGLHAQDKIFPSHSSPEKTDTLLVTSLALTL